MRWLLAAVLLGCLLLAASGCSDSQHDREEVRRVLEVRARALNTRDLPLYLTVVSPRYSDRGKNLEALRDGLEAGFKIYEKVAYQAEDTVITVKGHQAHAAGRFRMKVVIRGREMVLDGKERITLAKEAGGWKITAGL